MNFKYGFSYYPEHCQTRYEIEKDYELIKKSGANIVRMGEFAWDRMEPENNYFDFDWLEEIINNLGKRGIMSILCTPTAAPPAWLCKEYDIAYVNALDYEKPFGARRHYCPTKSDMRFFSQRIAEKMAERFGNNPYVFGWQIDNELAHNGSGRCRCKNCEKLFREYLKEKFDNDISELNSAFGTYFWSGEYNSFEQITLPIGNIERNNNHSKFHAFNENPSYRLEFEKFSSQMMIDFMNMQIDTIKKYSDKPVTTNSTGLATNNIDYYRLYEKTDNYGIDNYPPLYKDGCDYMSVNFAHGRGCKENKPFWIMEFAIGGGYTVSGEGCIQPYPGAIEQSVVYSYASGASVLLHFQYKAFRSGSEQLDPALLDTDRIPRRRYFEFRKTSEIIAKLESKLGHTVRKKSRIAIVMSYNDLWASEIKSAGKSYIKSMSELHSIMNELNLSPEIISADAHLDDYTIVFTSMPITMDESFKAKLKAFTQNGGTVVTTVCTAIKDENNLALDITFPGGLTDLFGIEVQEAEPIVKGINDTDITLLGSTVSAVCWLEELKCVTAESIAEVETGWRRGKCVMSKNRYGNGTAYYLGTYAERNNMKRLIKHITDKADIHAPIEPIYGTDIQIMEDDNGKEYIFIFNFLLEKTNVVLNDRYYDVINERVTENSVTIEAKGYICIMRI